MRGAVMHEFRALVEKRGVVFVGFDDEERRFADARAEMPKFSGTPPIRKPGFESRVLEHPREHRSRRGFAVRAGDRQHPAAAQHVFGEPLRARKCTAGRGSSISSISALPRATTLPITYTSGLRSQLLGAEAFDELDALRFELRAHRRIHVRIAAGHAYGRPPSRCAAMPPMKVPQMPRMWMCMSGGVRP